MTTPEPPRKSYVSDGVTVAYPFSFELLQAQDLTVWVTPFGQPYDPVGNIVTNYSVVIEPDNIGGTITFTSAPPLLSFIMIRRTMIVDVPTDFSSLVPITGPNVDPVFLRISLLLQQVGVVNIEALHYPRNSPNVTEESTEVPILPEGYIWQGGPSSTVIAVKNEESPDASTLRTELSSQTNGADGSRMIGFYNNGVVGPPGGLTLNSFLNLLAGKITELTSEPIGTVKMYSCALPDDYILLNDGTVGDGSSGASYAGTAYQNLFEELWNNHDTSFLQIYDAGGIVTTRGANASADYSAHKRLELPKTALRSPSNIGEGSGVPSIQKFNVASGNIEPIQESGDPLFRYTLGQIVKFTTTGSLPSPLNTTDLFYVSPASPSQLFVYDTISNYSKAIPLVLSGGSGDNFIISLTRGSSPTPDNVPNGAYSGTRFYPQAGNQVGLHSHNYHKRTINLVPTDLQSHEGSPYSFVSLNTDDVVPVDDNILGNYMYNDPLSFFIKFGIKYK